MSMKVLKILTSYILLLAASGLMLQSRGALPSSHQKVAPVIRGISIHHTPNGTVTIDISLTEPAPYQTMRLSGPDRLVVDLKGTHEADLRNEYPARSQVLKGVRARQWKYYPAVFRVVADLKGDPVSSVRTMAFGIQIELKPRGADLASEGSSGTGAVDPPADTLKSETQTAQEDPPLNKVFQVHRFKDLSASLTAPVLPPDDRLVPIVNPERTNHSPTKAATLASVSGISIQRNDHGETTIDIPSSRSVPYRVFQLTHPFRLVIDLKDARDTSSRKVYPVDSPVLKRVRVGQWRSDNPAVVRVVADLEGYPIFDVHAQRPGIRVELESRQRHPQVVRNPFKFQTSSQPAQVSHPPARTSQALPKQSRLLAAAPGNSLSSLKVIGFVEGKDARTQAVIADRANIYLVPKGGKFATTFTVLAIMGDAVVVQNLETGERRWINYTP